MSRKNILQGLMAGTPSPAPAAAERPRATKGAIGAVSRSIADLKARAVIEVDPFLIDAGGLQDRLESDAAEDAELARSIATYGQQVPVLVRPHPTDENRFQIVYGRRRVLALRDLGQPVKALVRDLDDREAVLAQGQENTARRDLSFIEKVNFARQMADAGYDRKAICDALSVDKTLISRMVSVSERVPVALIEAIGAASGIGRDRWLALAELMEKTDDDLDTLISTMSLTAEGQGSDQRFEALFSYLSGQRRREPPAPLRTEPLTGHDGRPLGDVSRGAASVVLRLRRSHAKGFEEWLLQNLPDLHRSWESDRNGK
ncbi:plasmid partitioning protein RepB (plasmid) [Cereibacter sphaeroides]|uniref:plasmid partitioning protein RepB n=1 Tax=Cereibacter sphaeroides TaxID=1063 RepID=UPI000F53E6AA|nr:plasmid partitioning protein RepB [Cereibacter sphaeroides]AZB66356.1 plasmid partitioning protein RepB [Cereibacter sphaeroides]AZB71199.1 plasmid partitioning protein RepB [Cereibacter sphaeroides]